MTEYNWADDFLAGLQQQLAIYQQILQLDQNQSELIDNRQTDDLIPLLAAKQKAIQAIDELNGALAPLREQWDNEGDSLPEAKRTPVETVVSEMREVLAQIVELENQGQVGLAEQKQTKGQKVAQIQTGKAMHKAYGIAKKKANSPRARYRDQRG